ncbi:topoisomerase DNA-binding C4 zinc finger domain-containing protein [Lactobacillus sp. 23-2]
MQADHVPACPNCGKPMILRSRRSDGTKFWGCSDFPKCRGTLNF